MSVSWSVTLINSTESPLDPVGNLVEFLFPVNGRDYVSIVIYTGLPNALLLGSYHTFRQKDRKSSSPCKLEFPQPIFPGSEKSSSVQVRVPIPGVVCT